MSLRTRDILQLERELQGQVHPAVFKALVKFAEDNAAMKQMIMQMAGTLDRVLTVVGQQMQVSEHMRSLLPHVQREREANIGVSSDPTLTGETNED